MTRVGAVLLLAITLTGMTGVVASGQEAGGRKGKAGLGKDKGERVMVTLVVDGESRHRWTHGELRALATEQWTNPSGAGHPAIAFWRLLETQGVVRAQVTEVRVKPPAGPAETFAGDTLGRLDGMMLRTGRNAGRLIWQLVPVDVAGLKGKLGGRVDTIEVVTRTP
jgi:hypothetical protein